MSEKKQTMIEEFLLSQFDDDLSKVILQELVNKTPYEDIIKMIIEKCERGKDEN